MHIVICSINHECKKTNNNKIHMMLSAFDKFGTVVADGPAFLYRVDVGVAGACSEKGHPTP